MDSTKVDRENMRATLPAKALIKGPDNEPKRTFHELSKENNTFSSTA
jgi:hypothetical protein